LKEVLVSNAFSSAEMQRCFKVSMLERPTAVLKKMTLKIKDMNVPQKIQLIAMVSISLMAGCKKQHPVVIRHLRLPPSLAPVQAAMRPVFPATRPFQ
jgi:hypothetical protein